MKFINVMYNKVDFYIGLVCFIKCIDDFGFDEGVYFGLDFGGFISVGEFGFFVDIFD